MGHSLTRTNLTINQNFVFQNGSQATNKMLTSDLKGNVNWNYPADFMIEDPLEHYIGELYGGGIVVSVWKEFGAEKLLIASVKDYSEFVPNSRPWLVGSEKSTWQWSTLNWDVLFTRSMSFGLDNSNSNILVDTNAVAISKCLNYTNEDLGLGVYNDWYLPAPNEVLTMLNSAAILNRVLSSFASDRSFRLVTDRGYNVDGIPYVNLSQVNLIMQTSYNNYQNVVGGYWTSTPAYADGGFNALYVNATLDVPNTWYQPGNFILSYPKTSNLTVRPFRIHTVWNSREY